MKIGTTGTHLRASTATAALIVSACLTGCMTNEKGRQISSDVFNLQTRVLELESSLSQQGKATVTTSETANQKIASTNVRLETIERDLGLIKGDLDSIRVGVVTGRMPGTAPEEASISDTLAELRSRLETVEVNQTEILAAIENSAKGKGGKKGASKDSDSAKPKERTALDTPKAIKQAFEQNRFAHVVEDGEKVVKSAKGSDKEEMLYIYAESLFKLGRLRDAALNYNDFLEAAPNSKHAAHARLRMGDAFRHLGDEATARLYYEELVSKNPGTPSADSAKERLAKLKGKK